MVQLTHALLASAIFLTPTLAGVGTCYFPDGSPSPNDFVCNSTTSDGFSSCCGTQNDGSQAYCMSNGLCLSDMFLSRGSCTDKNWKSKNCAQVCTTTNPNGGVGVRPCGYTGNWDCGNGTGCASNAIKIPTGTFLLTNAQLNSMGAQPVSSGSATSSASAAPASSSSSSSSSPSASSTAAAATATPSGFVQASQVTAVGAGVGIPLGLLAAAFIGLYLFERRKTNRLRQQIAFEQQQLQSAKAPGAGSSGPGSAYHPSILTAPANLNRMPSSHSGVMSPTSNYGQGHGQPQMGMQSVGVGMQRGLSASSNTHPAYREVNGTPPPPPPKAFQAHYAEAPGNNVQGQTYGHQRGYSTAQELPTDR